MKAVVLGAGEGESITDRPERSLVIRFEHELVDVTEIRIGAAQAGADLHVHLGHADGFYVLEGTLVFKLGSTGDRQRVPAVTLVLIPAGLVHGFDADESESARFLNFHAPSCGFAESLRARRHEGYEPERYDAFEPSAGDDDRIADVVVRGPGEGASIAIGSSRGIFKGEAGDGDGTFSLTELTLAPGFPEPAPHFHERLVDSFYVLEGVLTLRFGEREVEAGAGSFAAVPPGTVHTFSNRSGAVVRMLNLMAPAGLEQYLKEVAAAMKPDEPPDPAVMARIASRYDFHPA
jgi:mannose-6-phosphate isomerase-like protein (cupin superfamily)